MLQMERLLPQRYLKSLYAVFTEVKEANKGDVKLHRRCQVPCPGLCCATQVRRSDYELVFGCAAASRLPVHSAP